MFLMVTLIGGLIHLFSIGYMSDELEPIVEDHQVHTETGHLKRRGRFGRVFLFMALFCFLMRHPVLGDNLLSVVLRLELVGLLLHLINTFYYHLTKRLKPANQAFMV